MSDYVRIFDTTLRDGEQSPGATMTRDEKMTIARQLERLGVDVIEAGFPAASRGEIEAVRDIASIVKNAEIAALCRTRETDIERSWEAIGEAAKPRLHVFIATSDIHLEHKLKMDRAQVLAEIERGVAHCRSLCERVEFSAEDATRTPIGFLLEAFECAIENGATVLNIPDTVGYTMPEEYFRIVSAVHEMVGERDVVISTHCHNDLGLAVANSLAAVSAGARQIECTINGIGERAGNASLEEVAMALRTRSDLTGIETRLNTPLIVSTSRMVSEITGIVVQPNKAIVGRNAFAHEAGIHQHGVLQERTTYEIMTPESVGCSESLIVLGKHSGRHALVDRLESLGYQLDKAQVHRTFTAFKALCDKKKNIYDEDLHALVSNDLVTTEKHFELIDMTFSSGITAEPKSSIKLRVGDKVVEATVTGDGPVNAAFEAIKICAERPEVSLEQYNLSAISEGSDAQGRVGVTIESEGIMSRGQGTHTDVVVASALAFVSAMNHHVVQVDRREQLAEGRPGSI